MRAVTALVLAISIATSDAYLLRRFTIPLAAPRSRAVYLCATPEDRVRELEEMNRVAEQRRQAAEERAAATEADLRAREQREAASNAAAAQAAAQAQAAAEQRMAEEQAEREKLNKLFLSIVIDIIGMATYAVPVAGEAGDIAWAPISAYLVYQLYGNGLISGLAFAEELLPGLDIIPTATIAWILENTEFGQTFAGKAPAGAPGVAPPGAEKGDGMKRAEGEEL